MSSSLTAASAVTKSTAPFHHNKNGQRKCSHSLLSFHEFRNPAFSLCTKSRKKHSLLVQAHAHLKEVPDDESIVPAKNTSKKEVPVLATEETISEFINQVANLVKLVDSRDIVELQLKQLDCEVVIRKKEALPQPLSQLPPTVVYSPSPPVVPPAPSLPAPVSVPVSSPTPGQTSAAPAAKSAKSSLPPLKCPMAGTFYRSPGPGEPPFVKVGDKVKKGQVLCIIEAMKLMNEIEADQSGTIIEIVAEDGKPVSVDMPLFIIEP